MNLSLLILEGPSLVPIIMGRGRVMGVRKQKNTANLKKIYLEKKGRQLSPNGDIN